ncbi:MAG: zf-HC2 domain-containing protein [Candidatus Zixiibacteriota bacterium]
MSCEKYHELISARLDREISAQELETLDSHLKECPACCRFAEDLAEMREICRNSELIEMPAALEKEIVNNTIKSPMADQSIFDHFRGYYRIPRGLVWASMIIGLLLIGETILKPFQPDKPTAVVSIENISNDDIVRKVVFTDDDIVSSSILVKPLSNN